MPYVVHGASGAQGGPLLTRLLSNGTAAVGAVRNPGQLKGKPVIAVDNASVDSLTVAYHEVDGVFAHLPAAPEPVRRQYAQNIVAAIKAARPKRVVASTSGAIIDMAGSPLQASDDSAIMILVNGIRDSGISHSIVAPRLYLENLLLPPIFEAAKADGTLSYPIRANFPVSWCSHLDVAEAAQKLLTDHSVSGIVGVGHLPGLGGEDLATGFAEEFGRGVAFQSLAPDSFGKLIEPMFGPAAANVVGLYKALWEAPANVIRNETSAQSVLGLMPRSVRQWLAETLG
ncbi:SDR family oxidoreductase [Aminobacter aganoensis]|uniref:Uncharacterized protein YbjT (DUF2867 family) n=1 Tax=Aminobacter aganoensis TaxID=83264 RepID=A0A7X0FAA0_9HYPH|nr:NAD(P)H-binding protein [Aminobacter aganoensis]MBB6355804.1 uncharacterized protein YbjT (DUF2867 family) [Aminobacter aganoensis]